MKKTIYILTFIFATILLISNASALLIDAAFSNNNGKEITINFGESTDYYADIIYDIGSPLLNVTGRLFEENDVGQIYFKKILFDVSYTDGPFFVESFTIAENDYEGAGVYYINIIATETKENGDLTTRTEILTLTVEGEEDEGEVTASFVYDPENPREGQTVTFTSTSTSVNTEITQEEWFVDGTSIDVYNEAQSIFTYEFTNGGSYEVTLRVTDGEVEDEITQTVVVSENIPPVADFVYNPGEPVTKQEVTFTSTSYDEDGEIVSYEWFIEETQVQIAHKSSSQQQGFVGILRNALKNLFNNNHNDDEEPIALKTTKDLVSEEEEFVHVFNEEGNYEVTLKVTDDFGAEDEIIKIVVVSENVPPVADFIYVPEEPEVDETITFTSTSTSVNTQIIREEWLIDGESVDVFDEAESTFTRAFEEEAQYLVTLRVTDTIGVESEITKSVFVGMDIDDFLFVDFTYEPAQPIINEEITFTSISEAFIGSIETEEWFVDGTSIDVFNYEESIFTHNFETEGDYEVRLVVTNDEGLQNEETKTITVLEEPEGELVAVIKGPGAPFIEEEIQYTASDSYDTTGAEIVSYEWTMKRGTQTIYVEETVVPYLYYTFSASGQHYLTLVITNEYGDTAETTKSIYASRPYKSEEEKLDFGRPVSVGYHSVVGTDFGVVNTGEDFVVSVTITNNKDERINNVRGSFSLPEYGFVIKSDAVSLRPGETRTISFPVLIDDFDFISPGDDHIALLGVYGNGISRSSYFPFTLI